MRVTPSLMSFTASSKVRPAVRHQPSLQSYYCKCTSCLPWPHGGAGATSESTADLRNTCCSAQNGLLQVWVEKEKDPWRRNLRSTSAPQ